MTAEKPHPPFPPPAIAPDKNSRHGPTSSSFSVGQSHPGPLLSATGRRGRGCGGLGSAAVVAPEAIGHAALDAPGLVHEVPVRVCACFVSVCVSVCLCLPSVSAVRGHGRRGFVRGGASQHEASPEEAGAALRVIARQRWAPFCSFFLNPRPRTGTAGRAPS